MTLTLHFRSVMFLAFMDFSVVWFGFKMEHVFRLADTHRKTQYISKRSGRPYEKKIDTIVWFFFLCVQLNSILRGYTQDLFLLCHVYPMDKQYLIMMVCMFSILVIITFCIPMMINPPGVFSPTPAMLGILSIILPIKVIPFRNLNIALWPWLQILRLVIY